MRPPRPALPPATRQEPDASPHTLPSTQSQTAGSEETSETCRGSRRHPLTLGALSHTPGEQRPQPQPAGCSHSGRGAFQKRLVTMPPAPSSVSTACPQCPRQRLAQEGVRRLRNRCIQGQRRHSTTRDSKRGHCLPCFLLHCLYLDLLILGGLLTIWGPTLWDSP